MEAVFVVRRDRRVAGSAIFVGLLRWIFDEIRGAVSGLFIGYRRLASSVAIDARYLSVRGI
jgi:hypothetical protein